MPEVAGEKVGGPATEGGVEYQLILQRQLGAAAWGLLPIGWIPERGLRDSSNGVKNEGETFKRLRILGCKIAPRLLDRMLARRNPPFPSSSQPHNERRFAIRIVSRGEEDVRIQEEAIHSS